MESLGYRYISDEIPTKEQDLINDKAEELLSETTDKFELWLKEKGYENTMGMIIKIS